MNFNVTVAMNTNSGVHWATWVLKLVGLGTRDFSAAPTWSTPVRGALPPLSVLVEAVSVVVLALDLVLV